MGVGVQRKKTQTKEKKTTQLPNEKVFKILRIKLQIQQQDPLKNVGGEIRYSER